MTLDRGAFVAVASGEGSGSACRDVSSLAMDDPDVWEFQVRDVTPPDIFLWSNPWLYSNGTIVIHWGSEQETEFDSRYDKKRKTELTVFKFI